MLINTNHLLLFIFFSTSFILLANAHLILFCSSLLSSFIRAGNVLYRSPIYFRGTSCMVRRFTAGEPHVWFADLRQFSRGTSISFADLLPGNLMYGSPIYCRGTSCMVRRFTPILAGNVKYRSPIYCRGTSCMVRRFTAGEPHVWFADLLPGNLMYGSPIYAHSQFTLSEFCCCFMFSFCLLCVFGLSSCSQSASYTLA